MVAGLVTGRQSARTRGEMSGRASGPPDEYGNGAKRMIMLERTESMAVCLEQERVECSPLPAWKRLLDLLCIVVSLPVTLPLGLAIALYIKWTSPGPVLFRQERIGYRGQRFWCLKFRTMRVDADTRCHQQHLQNLLRSDAPMTKLDVKGDPRLIRGGAFLRATGLDELPQLINVLRGEMSLVGPRPCLPYEYEQYDEWARQRCLAVPGLTGLWQVSGKNHTTFRRMIELDIQYAQTKSLWLDLRIMWKTFSALAAQVRETRAAVRTPTSPSPATSDVPAANGAVKAA
jgi:lipopolysaccharide/colanic/teichoic acid biosynthesis glycosyltransferase